jgi:hypothetical protein
VRDKKLRGIKSKGIIKQLSEEMVETAKLEIGYCDSDDDSEEEEEEDVEQQKRRELPVAHKRKTTHKRASTTFAAYRRDSNLHVARGTGDEAAKPMALAKRFTKRLSSLKGMEMTEVPHVNRQTVCYIKGIRKYNGSCY